jgi:hypothetical protein
MADLIYSKFIAAGFSDAQAKGAIANAYSESRLNPSAYFKNNNEESVGLFQANRNGGLGSGYTVDQLKDPNLNIDLAIAQAKKSPRFISATTAEEATRAFMLEVERPKNQSESAQLARIKNLENFSTQMAGNLPGPVAAATPVPAATTPQKGNMVDSLSTQISNMTNEFLSGFREGAGAPPIINNTNVTNGGTSAQTVSVRDERLTEEQFRNLGYPQSYA